MIHKSVIIIPSLNPDEHLIEYVKDIISRGFEKIILVDDGSNEKNRKIFENLSQYPECDLLVHAVNMGKGRALKDAFNYYLCNYVSQFKGIITADSDGQHTVEDIIKLDERMDENSNSLILGTRNFEDPSVPFKSRFGNKLTRMVMKILIGGGITDTQTGLQAIPNKLIPSFLTLYGERFEYETTMLIETICRKIPIQEEIIQTVYINNNQETHFRPIADSFAIYRLIFASFIKYILASLSSFLIDYSVFCLLIYILRNFDLSLKIGSSTIIARIVSSLYNYHVNKAIVFRNREKGSKTFIKYYILCIIQMSCSALGVWSICGTTGISETLIKPVIDMLLFVISFQIQKNWVFEEVNV